jgi:hypothetical protein
VYRVTPSHTFISWSLTLVRSFLYFFFPHSLMAAKKKAKVACPCGGDSSYHDCVNESSPYNWDLVPKTVPRKGWTYLNYYDAGEYGNENCSMCKHSLKYVHKVHHHAYDGTEDGFPNPLTVGCVCANYLIAEGVASNNTGNNPLYGSYCRPKPHVLASDVIVQLPTDFSSMFAFYSPCGDAGLTPKNHATEPLKGNWKPNKSGSGCHRTIAKNSAVYKKLREALPKFESKIKIHYFTAKDSVAATCEEVKGLRWITEADVGVLNTIREMAVKYGSQEA